MTECDHDFVEAFRRPVYDGGVRREGLVEVFYECKKCEKRTLNLVFTGLPFLNLNSALEITDYAEAMTGLPLNGEGPLPPINKKESDNYIKVLTEQIIPSISKDYDILTDDVILLVRLYQSRWIHRDEIPVLLKARAIYRRLIEEK